MRDEKGITLGYLIMTIIVIMILSSIAIYSGAGTINYVKFNKAKNEMQLVQANVNAWHQEYSKLDSEAKKTAYIDKYGVSTDHKTCDQTALDKTLNDNEIINTTNYRFLSEKYLKENLGMDESFEFLINIPENKVILFNGIEYQGETYYTPEDFGILNVKNTIYIESASFNVALENDTDIVISDLQFFEADKEKTNARFKVSISKFDVYFKKTSDDDSAWTKVTSKLIESKDNNETKYRFPAPVDETAEYIVRVSTTDNKSLGEQKIFIETRTKIASIPGVTTPFLPDGARVTNNHFETGLTIKDKNGNEWVWIEVPKAITENATTDSDIEQALENYTSVDKDGASFINRNGYKDVWYDYLGSVYDGEHEYCEVKYIGNDSDSQTRYNEARNYYGSLFTNTELTELANNYVAGTTYYARITDKLDDQTGCGLTYSEYNTKKSAMLQSIKANGGFYIGKYETGYEGTNHRKSGNATVDPTQVPVIKQNAYPYNFVTCSQAENLAESFSNGVDNKNTTLMFGIQWDLVLKHLNVRGGLTSAQITSNSSDWGNYRNSSFTIDRGEWAKFKQWRTWNKVYDRTKDDENYVQNETKMAEKSEITNSGCVLLSTGAVNNNSKLNIYDLVGNVWNMTIERTNKFARPCSERGGCYENYSRINASYRDDFGYAYSCAGFTGFRTSLY